MNSRRVKGILLSLVLCSAIFAALATVGITLLQNPSFGVHYLSSGKSASPDTTLLGDPVPGGGIPCGNGTGGA
jgi:hypothetical protein